LEREEQHLRKIAADSVAMHSQAQALKQARRQRLYEIGLGVLLGMVIKGLF